MEVDGIYIAGGALSTIAGVVITYLKMHKAQPRTVEPTPLPVTTEKTPKYVTVQEFNKHVEDNARDHENLFGRMNRNDRETSELKGILTSMRDDLSAIKHKLFKTR